MEDLDKQLENALKKDIVFKLPEDFAEKILVKLDAKDIKPDRNLFWWISGLGMLLIMLAIGTLAYSGSLIMFKSLIPYTSWFLTVTLAISVIQVLDHKLVKKHAKAY